MNGNRNHNSPALLPAHTPTHAARLLSCATGGTFVVTLNAELIARALASPPFATLIRAADYWVCDGIGAAALLRKGASKASLPRIAGIDLGFAVLQLAARRGESVFLLGGKPGVAHRAAKRLQRAIPHLQIAGCAHGYFTEADLPALRGAIHRSNASVVIVCLGSPRQEEWILRCRRYLPAVRLFLPLGGSLDVWAGQVNRAPLFWQSCGIEWLWRLLHQPSRIGRLTATLADLWKNKPPKNRTITDILFQIE